MGGTPGTDISRIILPKYLITPTLRLLKLKLSGMRELGRVLQAVPFHTENGTV